MWSYYQMWFKKNTKTPNSMDFWYIDFFVNFILQVLINKNILEKDLDYKISSKWIRESKLNNKKWVKDIKRQIYTKWLINLSWDNLSVFREMEIKTKISCNFTLKILAEF